MLSLLAFVLHHDKGLMVDVESKILSQACYTKTKQVLIFMMTQKLKDPVCLFQDNYMVTFPGDLLATVENERKAKRITYLTLKMVYCVK